VPHTSSTSVSPPQTEGTVELSDGRSLGYAAYGPEDGDPLLFFHGTPGSRYTRVPDTGVLDDHGVRQITLERPGFGLSTYDPDRTLLDWPEDVREAADALGYDRFAVAGASGGGPFTLACAAAIPDRLTGVGVIGGLGPLDVPEATDGMEWKTRIGFTLAKVPLLLRPFLWFRIRKIRSDPDAFVDVWADSAAEPDRRVLERPDVRAVVCENFPEAVRQGTKAPLKDNRIHVRSWGFDLSEIPVHVDVFHGRHDEFVPESMARHVADGIPSSDLHRYPDEGHLLHYEHVDEVLGTLGDAS
jgi:pimeloyl-ACP methyl ester carboxylesterase